MISFLSRSPENSPFKDNPHFPNCLITDVEQNDVQLVELNTGTFLNTKINFEVPEVI